MSWESVSNLLALVGSVLLALPYILLYPAERRDKAGQAPKGDETDDPGHKAVQHLRKHSLKLTARNADKLYVLGAIGFAAMIAAFAIALATSP
ncbi:MAG: hypothetical protein NXI16_04480 [Alphaproteobacteria bacterium]|nr:hypothetical protein [Alphaproteobacteria bacterium]